MIVQVEILHFEEFSNFLGVFSLILAVVVFCCILVLEDICSVYEVRRRG